MGALLTYLIFGRYLTDPNSFMFAFGGDPLVIYYDVMYHTCYGQGTTLTAMNYPYGEYIFLTDAQSSMSLILQWIHHHLFEVCDYVVGIIHFVNIYLLFVAFVLLYFILERLEVKWWIAAVFAPMVVLLCPLMVRFGGHFGLAYPFLILLAILWYLRKERVARLEKRDVIVFFVFLLFTFNNPYIGFVSLLPLLVLSSLTVLFSGPQKYKKAMILAGMALLVLAIPYITFKLNDPVTDRIKLQWGFFYFNTTLEGLVFPQGTIAHTIVHKLLGIDIATQFERKQYLGLVNIIVFSIGLIWVAVKLFQRKIVYTVKNRELMLLGLTAFLLFIFTSVFLWKFVNEDWMEAHLGFLLMFKAMARLNWPFYFLVSMLTLILLNKFVLNSKKVGLVAFCLCAIIWAFEVNREVALYHQKNVYPNYLGTPFQQETKDLARSNNIDTANYQAMLVLPKMMAWNDNLLSDIHFNSQFYSMKLSLATGIPLVSSMLSRMSVNQISEAIQLLSHPWIKKELSFKFPNNKPLLLLLGKDGPPLKYGEQYLTEISDKITETEHYSLWSLPISRLQDNAIRENLLSKMDENSIVDPIVYVDFDDKPLPNYYGSPGPDMLFGKGLKNMAKGQHILLDTIIAGSGNMDLSVWLRVDHQRYGMGSYVINIKDSLGSEYVNEFIDPRNGNDIDHLWLRTSFEWNNKPNSRISITYNADKVSFIDELMIRNKEDTVFIKYNGKVSANGYILN